MTNMGNLNTQRRRPLRIIIISIISVLLAVSFAPSRASSKITCRGASKVIFVPNGDDVIELRSGSNKDAEIQTVCAVNGVVDVPKFSRPGYSLAGWTGEPDFGSEQNIVGLGADSETWTSNANATRAFAQWQPVQYSVSYNNNGGNSSASTVSSTYSATIYVGATITNDVYSFSVPTRNGYRFVGWSFNGNTYAPGSLIDAPASNVVFTAVWVSA